MSSSSVRQLASVFLDTIISYYAMLTVQFLEWVIYAY